MPGNTVGARRAAEGGKRGRAKEKVLMIMCGYDTNSMSNGVHRLNIEVLFEKQFDENKTLESCPEWRSLTPTRQRSEGRPAGSTVPQNPNMEASKFYFVRL